MQISKNKQNSKTEHHTTQFNCYVLNDTTSK